jgi:hypothetical protein
MAKNQGNLILKRAEHGKARIEYYAPDRTEEFGLNKRTRRLAKGQIVTRPDGRIITSGHLDPTIGLSPRDVIRMVYGE